MSKRTLSRDDNRVPIRRSDIETVTKSVTFDGSDGSGGTAEAVSLYSVDGEVIVKIFGVCTTNLEGASATVEVGTSGNPDSIIGQATATDIDSGDIWHGTNGSATAEVIDFSQVPEHLVANDSDIEINVETADVTAGAIDFHCLVEAVSDDGQVTAS